MKTAAEWVDEIEQYMLKNPVATLEAAKEQIKDIVDMVQKDAARVLSEDLGLPEPRVFGVDPPHDEDEDLEPPQAACSPRS